MPNSKKLIIEGHLNSWFFTENKESFNGNSIKQKPLLSAQLHATYIFKPGIWLAGSFGRSGLGETIVNGVEKDDLQKNSRYGVAFACRVNKNSFYKRSINTLRRKFYYFSCGLSIYVV